jgi:hypothetical protein
MSYDAGRGKGFLLAYRGSNDASRMTLFPRGLPDATTFNLWCEEGPGDGTLAGGVRLALGLGADLDRHGVVVEIPNPNGAALIHFAPDAVPPGASARPR